MESAIAVFVTLVAVTCAVVLMLAYRSLKAPFFLYLLVAGLALAGAAAASCFGAWPPAVAATDLGLAASGAALAVASRQLLLSFRLAGECYD